MLFRSKQKRNVVENCFLQQLIHLINHHRMEIIHYIVLTCQLSFSLNKFNSFTLNTLGLIHCRSQVQKFVTNIVMPRTLPRLCTKIHRTEESDIGRKTNGFANTHQIQHWQRLVHHVRKMICKRVVVPFPSQTQPLSNTHKKYF